MSRLSITFYMLVLLTSCSDGHKQERNEDEQNQYFKVFEDSVGADSINYRKYTVYYSDSTPRLRYTKDADNDVMVGKYYSYYKNGAMRQMGSFTVGLPYGAFKYYDREGNIKQFETYELVSDSTSILNERIVLDENKNVIENSSFYFNYRLLSEGQDSLMFILKNYLPRNPHVERTKLVFGHYRYDRLLIDSANFFEHKLAQVPDTMVIPNYIDVYGLVGGYLQEECPDGSVAKDSSKVNRMYVFTNETSLD